MFLLCDNVSCLGLTRHWNGTLELVVSMLTIHLFKEQVQTLRLSKRRLRKPFTTSHWSKAKHSYTQFTTTSWCHNLLLSNMSYPAPQNMRTMSNMNYSAPKSMRTVGQKDWRWAWHMDTTTHVFWEIGQDRSYIICIYGALRSTYLLKSY